MENKKLTLCYDDSNTLLLGEAKVLRESVFVIF